MKSDTRKAIRIIGKVLFALYVIFIIWFLIFSDWYGRTGVQSGYHYNLVLFNEIKRFWNNIDTLGWYPFIANVIGNVIIFVPFGIFFPMGCKKRQFFSTVILGLSLSCVVEVFQLISELGSLDVDDIFLNTLGVVIGFIVNEIIYYANSKKNRRGRYGR